MWPHSFLNQDFIKTYPANEKKKPIPIQGYDNLDTDKPKTHPAACSHILTSFQDSYPLYSKECCG